MLKKIIAPLLIVATTLFTTVPSEVFSQTPAQPKAVASEHTLSSALVKPKTTLRAVFANEIASANAKTLTATDYRRLDDKQQQQTSKPGWGKREKVALIIIIIAVVAVTTLLLVHGIDDSPVDCANDLNNPFCS